MPGKRSPDASRVPQVALAIGAKKCSEQRFASRSRRKKFKQRESVEPTDGLLIRELNLRTVRREEESVSRIPQRTILSEIDTVPDDWSRLVLNGGWCFEQCGLRASWRLSDLRRPVWLLHSVCGSRLTSSAAVRSLEKQNAAELLSTNLSKGSRDGTMWGCPRRRCRSRASIRIGFFPVVNSGTIQASRKSPRAPTTVPATRRSVAVCQRYRGLQIALRGVPTVGPCTPQA